MPRWSEPHAGSILISQRTPRAKREYTCDKCGELILPDEQYVREAYRTIDGTEVKTWSYTLHRVC